MKSGHRFLLCSVLCLAIAGAAIADNLLVNGDFETGDFTGWVVLGESPSSMGSVLSGDNGPSLPGTNNAYLSNEAEALALLLKQSTEAGSGVPGACVYSIDLKLDQADVGGVLFVNIFAEQAGGGVIGGSGLLGPLWPWNTWTTFSGSFSAPAGTDFLTIQVEAVTGAASGTNCKVHVDNVVLDQGTVGNEMLTFGAVKTLFR